MLTPAARRTSTSLSADIRLYTTHVANNVVAGMVKGRVFGMMSGMNITIWPGERPFWLASWISPAKRNIPVRATSDIRKTLTSSARIIRLTMPKYTAPPGSLPDAAEQPADRVDDPGQRLLGHPRWPVRPEVAGYPDAKQVSANAPGDVAAPAEHVTDVRPDRVELVLGVRPVEVHLPLAAQADRVPEQVELADLHPVPADAEHRVRLLERGVVHRPQPGQLDHVQHDRQVEHLPVRHVNGPAPLQDGQARGRSDRVGQAELGRRQPLDVGLRPELVHAGELLELEPRAVQGQVEPDGGAQLEPGLPADLTPVQPAVEPRNADHVRLGRVHLEPRRQRLDRLLEDPAAVDGQVADHAAEPIPHVQPAAAELARDGVPRHAGLHLGVAEGDGPVPVNGRKRGPRRRAGPEGRKVGHLRHGPRRRPALWLVVDHHAPRVQREVALRLQPQTRGPQPAGQGG